MNQRRASYSSADSAALAREYGEAALRVERASRVGRRLRAAARAAARAWRDADESRA